MCWGWVFMQLSMACHKLCGPESALIYSSSLLHGIHTYSYPMSDRMISSFPYSSLVHIWVKENTGSVKFYSLLLTLVCHPCFPEFEWYMHAARGASCLGKRLPCPYISRPCFKCFHWTQIDSLAVPAPLLFVSLRSQCPIGPIHVW